MNADLTRVSLTLRLPRNADDGDEDAGSPKDRAARSP